MEWLYKLHRRLLPDNPETDPLTDRERQVLRLAADGKSSADIATTIHLAGISRGSLI